MYSNESTIINTLSSSINKLYRCYIYAFLLVTSNLLHIHFSLYSIYLNVTRYKIHEYKY